MNKKHLIISILIAVLVGALMGGIDRVLNVYLGVFTFLVPIVILGGSVGISWAMSKKNKEKDSDENRERF